MRVQRRVVKALTYQPKIQGVKDGSIRTTIRYHRPSYYPHDAGDIITIHGWQGAPYRSPWSWRRVAVLEAVEEHRLILELCNGHGKAYVRRWEIVYDRWTNTVCTLRRIQCIAEHDGIQADPGYSQGETLMRMMQEMYLQDAIRDYCYPVPRNPGDTVRIPLIRYVWKLPFLEAVD